MRIIIVLCYCMFLWQLLSKQPSIFYKVSVYIKIRQNFVYLQSQIWNAEIHRIFWLNIVLRSCIINTESLKFFINFWKKFNVNCLLAFLLKILLKYGLPWELINFRLFATKLFPSLFLVVDFTKLIKQKIISQEYFDPNMAKQYVF